MSVDVFGHHLNSDNDSRRGSRGPPGEGFKTTPDGQYDMDNRRLCNLDDALHMADAVSLKIMQNVTDKAISMIQSIESRFMEMIKHQSETVEKALTKHSELISHLESKVNTLEESRTLFINDTNVMVRSLQLMLTEQLKSLEESINTDQDLIFRNSEIISKLDKRLTALEHGQEKNSGH